MACKSAPESRPVAAISNSTTNAFLSHSKSRMPQNNNEHGHQKKRSRNGCRTCRKRHQKCDERRPTCMNCRLRGIECGGYGVTLTDFTSYSGMKGQMVSRLMRDNEDRESQQDDDEPIPTRAEGPASVAAVASPSTTWEKTVNHHHQPLAMLHEVGDPNQLPLLEAALDPEIFNALDMGNDVSRPVSPIDFALVGEWSPGIINEHDATDEVPDTIEAAIGSGGDLLDLALFQHFDEPVIPPAPQDPFDQYLFTYYMDTLALRLYPIRLDGNPYRVVYGSLATESEPMLKVIMLASALHLVKLGKLPAFAIKHYRTAARDSFRKALGKKQDTWSLGVTVLLSVVFDIIGTGVDAWSSKLIGCRRLLKMAIQTSCAQTPIGLQCLLLQYNWAVTMAKTLLKGSVPAATIDELKCIDAVHGGTSDELELAKHQSQWWDNLPDYQMHLLLREATDLSLLIDRLKAFPDRTDELLQIMPDVADLVQRIQSWQPEASAIPPEYVDSIAFFNDIWRAGMLCFVYSEIYSLGPGDARLQACVEASVRPLRQLSWLQACLFPMFIIAVHARTEEARAVFTSKLGEMHGLLGFQGPLSVASVLQCIWQRSDSTAGSGRLEWREVVRELGLELNVLL
ncbi:fungal-specific transcription factor domain-containing protein [Aspergillus heterothallicus]